MLPKCWKDLLKTPQPTSVYKDVILECNSANPSILATPFPVSWVR